MSQPEPANVTDVVEPTPGHVAAEAQIDGALPLNRLALIGIFSKSGGDTALLRQADGSILSVGVGDRAGRLTVTALAADRVHLSDGSTLEMPG